MNEWWNGLDTLMRVLYCIAIPSTLILLIQTVMSIIGFGEGGGGIDTSDTSGLGMDMGGDAGFDIPDGGDISLGDAGGAADVGDIGATANADGVFAAADAATAETLDGGNPADFGAMRFFTLQGIIAFLTVFSWSAIAITHMSNATVGIIVGLLLGAAAMYMVAKIIRLSGRLVENGNIEKRNAIGVTGTVYLTIPAHGEGVGKITATVQGRMTEFAAITDGEALKTGTPIRIIDVRGETVVAEREN